MEHNQKPATSKRLEEMTPEERLRSLQEFAEEKKYIHPGGGEILPATSSTNAGGFNSVTFGNEWQGLTSFKMAKPAYDIVNLPPPSYNTATREQPPAHADRKPSLLDHFLGKHCKAKEAEIHEHADK